MEDDPLAEPPGDLLADRSYDEHFASIEAHVSALDDVEDAVDAARRWLASPRPAVRAVALDVLSRLVRRSVGVSGLVLAAAEWAWRDPDTEVRWSGAHALSALIWAGADGDEADLLVDRLITFAGDDDADVRWQVAASLPILNSERPHDGRRRALLQLVRDTDGEVRDYATMALASLSEDSPEIRYALRQCLGDGEVGHEAMWGLARRGDPAVLPDLLAALARPAVTEQVVEAAAALGDPSARQPLLVLRALHWDDTPYREDVLRAAIGACSRPFAP